jgi:type I restriction enzyme R subunit
MLEMKNLPHKNIAVEVLKNLLGDELTVCSRTNLMQSKALLKMLENALKRTTTKLSRRWKLLKEIITIAKKVTSSDQEMEEMGLTVKEYAFYTAAAANDSARDLWLLNALYVNKATHSICNCRPLKP